MPLAHVWLVPVRVGLEAADVESHTPGQRHQAMLAFAWPRWLAPFDEILHRRFCWVPVRRRRRHRGPGRLWGFRWRLWRHKPDRDRVQLRNGSRAGRHDPAVDGPARVRGRGQDHVVLLRPELAIAKLAGGP